MTSKRHPIGRLTNAVPLYVQVAENLIEQIESGDLQPGDRLPPERELSAAIGVNRLTVRQALSTLAAKGLLIRRQGSGTYVAEPKIERRVDKLVPFTRGMKRSGLQPGARVILLEGRPAEKTIARQLELAVATPIYFIHRLRFLNQEPVMLEESALPAHRFPGMEDQDLEMRSLYEVMETEYGVAVSRARQSLEPISASKYEARLMDIEPGAPLMLERRVGYDQHGNPVECAKDAYRGDRFRFVIEMAPQDT